MTDKLLMRNVSSCKLAPFTHSTSPEDPRGSINRSEPNTADEAIEKMLEQKKISSKINYDVLKDLNVKPGASPARTAESPRELSAAKLTGRKHKPTRASLSLSTPLSTLGKR
ncbi:unnamed protein product [Lampetra planeri]